MAHSKNNPTDANGSPLSDTAAEESVRALHLLPPAVSVFFKEFIASGTGRVVRISRIPRCIPCFQPRRRLRQSFADFPQKLRSAAFGLWRDVLFYKLLQAAQLLIHSPAELFKFVHLPVPPVLPSPRTFSGPPLVRANLQFTTITRNDCGNLGIIGMHPVARKEEICPYLIAGSED
jgi:hypothetical protein